MELKYEELTALAGNAKVKRRVPSLKKMIKDDKELADFFRFVYQNNLRQQALDALEKRMGAE